MRFIYCCSMFAKHFFNVGHRLTHQTREFAHRATRNQVVQYLSQAKLIDSVRLSLRSGRSDSLLPLLNDRCLDSFVVTNALRSAPSPESALCLVEALKKVPHFSHTQHTLHAIAKILAKARYSAHLKKLIDAINAGKFPKVVPISFMDHMRWYAVARDLDLVLSVWEEYRAQGRRPCTEGYNILMELYAQMGKDLDAVDTFLMMIKEGTIPNSRTYTVMMDHLVSAGKLDMAKEVFDILPLMRVKRTLKQFSLLVGAYSKVEQFDVVKCLLREMHMEGALPPRSMLPSLLHMREAGYVEETDELVKEMAPDDRIKNIEFCMGDSEDEDGDEEEDVHDSDPDREGVQLKPWLSPSALASALQRWRPDDVTALEDAKFVWTSRLVCKMIRNFKSAETAWKFFCWVAHQPRFRHDVHTVSRMVTKLARSGNTDLVDQLLLKVKEEGIKLPCSTIRLVIDFFGLSKNGDAALKVFHDVKTLCGPISGFYILLLYSSLLRTLSKCQKDAEVMDIVEEMSLCGIRPDIQTFSGLMYHFAVKGDFRTVQKLFVMVKQSGVKPDAYTYKILIDAYCKCGRAALALRLFEDMRNLNLMPDSATKLLLVNSLWKEGRLREAAIVEESCEKVNDILPRALPGHMFTVSSTDLKRAYEIYYGSFRATTGDKHDAAVLNFSSPNRT